MSLLAGFFDISKQIIIDVSLLDIPNDEIVFTSLQLSLLYQTGKHKLPSSVWVVFDKTSLSVFFLDIDKSPDFRPHHYEVIKQRVNYLRKINNPFHA